MNFARIKKPDNTLEFMIEALVYISLFICIALSPLLLSHLHPLEYQHLSLIELVDLRYLMSIIAMFPYVYLSILSVCLFGLMVIDYIKSIK